jgi:hypothetical protein
LTHANVRLWVADDERSANNPGEGSDNRNGPETALGPQYRLNGNAELGVTIEKSDVSAITANPDADRYTFGLRMTF